MITKQQAENIKQEIDKAKNILLHCHVNPDGDSYGSVLAMGKFLEKEGKKVTIIKGDSPKVELFEKMPGYENIIDKDISEIDLLGFDTFIVLDTSSREQVSRKSEVVFPESLHTINIDHHQTNTGFCKVSLVDASYASCAEMVYDLLISWGAEIEPGMATNIYIGIYTDTGGFKYLPSNFETIRKAADLAKISNGLYQEVMYYMDNNNQPEKLKLLGLAMNSIETYFQNTVWIAAVSRKELEIRGLPTYTERPELANMLKSVKGVLLGISFLEMEAGKINISIRTKDSEKYDVSKLAVALGGGGHKAAAAASLTGMKFEEAKEKLLTTIAYVYPELSN